MCIVQGASQFLPLFFLRSLWPPGLCLGQEVKMDKATAGVQGFCMCVQGSARVIRCLQDHRSSLSQDCQASLFDQEVMMSEEIDFKFPLKRACTTEIQSFCPGMQSGHANIVRSATTTNFTSATSTFRCWAIAWSASKMRYSEAQETADPSGIHQCCQQELL